MKYTSIILALIATSCTGSEVLTTTKTVMDTNYEVGVPVQTVIGDDMLNMSAVAYEIRETTLHRADPIYVRGGLQQGRAIDTLAVDAFRGVVKYSGISGSRIRLLYREFTLFDAAMIIRDSYTMDLEYDLAESDTIAFRSVKMHVHEATNAQINFTVIEDGGLPWLRAGL